MQTNIAGCYILYFSNLFALQSNVHGINIECRASEPRAVVMPWVHICKHTRRSLQQKANVLCDIHVHLPRPSQTGIYSVT